MVENQRLQKTPRRAQKAKIRYNRLYTLIFDILSSSATIFLAKAILRHKSLVDIDFAVILPFILFTVSSTLLSMRIFDLYKVLWKFAGIREIVDAFTAYAVNLAIILIVQRLFFDSIPLAFTLLFIFFDFFAKVGYRFSTRIYYSLKLRFFGADKNLTKIIIYGAGYTGTALAKSFLDNPQDGYVPVAFVDDDETKGKNVISNLRVIGGQNAIPDVMRKYKTNTIVIAINTMNKPRLREVSLYLKELGCTVKTISNMSDVGSKFAFNTPKLEDIKIENLLHRDAHSINQELLDRLVKDKVVMVTGGAGSIGSELCRQILRLGAKHLVIFDAHENGMFFLNQELRSLYKDDDEKLYTLVMGNVRDRDKLKAIMTKFKPSLVFHAAAYKHVPMMEINEDEAVKTNVFGTRNVIEVCNECHVHKFILISTDKAVNPANVMGCTKRTAELILQSKAQEKDFKTIVAAVRFGNVLGSNGSVIPIFLDQISKGGPVTVTDKNMKRYFMTIPEAVSLVIQAGSQAESGQVYVLNMGEPIYISQLAEDLIRLSGHRPNIDIQIEYTGLRKGEKLFEELSFNNENSVKTSIEDVFVCKLEKVDNKVLSTALEDLLNAVRRCDGEMAEKLLFKLVPSEYRNKAKGG